MVILELAHNALINVLPILAPHEFIRKQGILFLVRDESVRIYDPLNLETHKSIRIHQPLILETHESV